MSKTILAIGAAALLASFALPAPSSASARYELIVFHGAEFDIADHGLTMQDCIDAIEAERVAGFVATCRTERGNRPESVKGAFLDGGGIDTAATARRLQRGAMAESAEKAVSDGSDGPATAAAPIFRRSKTIVSRKISHG